MKKNIKKTINAYLNKVRKDGKIKIDSAYLFGSFALGKERIGSDIDVCLISPMFGKDIMNDRVFLMKLREGINDAIEPHPFSSEEWEVSFHPLISEIKKNGIKVL